MQLHLPKISFVEVAVGEQTSYWDGVAHLTLLKTAPGSEGAADVPGTGSRST